MYDINDHLIDEFDIDFGLSDIPFYSGGVDRRCEIENEIINYLKEKQHIPIKSEKKIIYSNTKGNSVFFASPCVKFTMISKILLL